MMMYVVWQDDFVSRKNGDFLRWTNTVGMINGVDERVEDDEYRLVMKGWMADDGWMIDGDTG